VDTQLNVVQEELNVLQNYILVLLVVLNELNQENVCFLNNFQIGILIFLLLQRLLLDNLHRNVVCS
jgi:hypothetical protein